MKIYNQTKAVRAIEHAKVIRSKIDRIRKNTKIEELEKRVKDLESVYVGITCPTCKRIHPLPIQQFKTGSFRGQCQECYTADTEKRDNDTREEIVKHIGKDKIAGSYISTDAPRHCITVCLPERKYESKK